MTRKEKQWNFIFFFLLLGIYSAVTLLLFHRQSVFYAGKYPSDMYYYIADIQGTNAAYEYPYRLMFWVAKVVSLAVEPRMAMALTVTAFNSLSVIILKLLADKFFADGFPDVKGRGILATVSVFSLFFVSMVYTDIGAGAEEMVWRYSGVYSPNPYHNATYLAARPFSILCFWLFVAILDRYEEQEQTRKRMGTYVLFATALFLATFAKPSFTLVFGLTAAVILLWRLVKAKGRNFRQTFWLALAFLPTIGDLLYQFWGVFGGKHGEDTGLGFGFLVAWSENSDNIPLSVVCGLLFPIVVLILNAGELKTDKYYRFSWQLLTASLVTVLCLYEKGYRLGHMNFAWGYMHAMFFVYVTSMALLIKKTLRKEGNPFWLTVQWGIYALHFVCGLDYFRVLLAGGTFA